MSDSTRINNTQDFKDETEKLVEYYRLRAGITTPFTVKYDARKRRLAHVFHKATPDGELIRVDMKFNHVTFMKLYKKDPKSAKKLLHFAVAHEIAHVEQREKKGLGYLVYTPDLLIESAADKRAYELTGMSKKEVDKASEKLTKKMAKKRKEKPSFVKKPKALMMHKGKPVARVMGWVSGYGAYKGKLIISKRNISDEEKEYLVPPTARKVELIMFDHKGTPVLKTRLIDRQNLKNYYLIP